MAPPTEPLNLNIDAISGICGSISIACWVVVFSPQILQNFQRGSAEGLSIQFIIVWLVGDVFNILGAVLQHVLPTMIILAIYYTIADLVLLCQCFYYRGFTWKDEVHTPPRPKPAHNAAGEPNERTGLLTHHLHRERRGSDWSTLSPLVPVVAEAPSPPPPPPTTLQTLLWNSFAVIMVCAAGVLGWFLSVRGSGPSEPRKGGQDLEFSFWGQIFGYLCAALYILSRLPQLVLNWRRKSTDGLSMLFFLFACLGNMTYVMSICAYDPICADDTCAPGEAAKNYGMYILLNLSWLAGSFLTLLLDLGVFVQYFMYNKAEEDDGSTDADEESIDEDRWDQRPLLQRGDSTFG
jgi:uncharacterized protein with PQ loop repeat